MYSRTVLQCGPGTPGLTLARNPSSTTLYCSSIESDPWLYSSGLLSITGSVVLLSRKIEMKSDLKSEENSKLLGGILDLRVTGRHLYN